MIKEIEKNKAKFLESIKIKAEGGDIAALDKEARDTLSPVTAFAAVYCAVQKGLGLTPYDTQLTAGAYLDDDAVVELATGEGKTLAAVFAAYYSVIKGEHVNIFTFNDYLAKRDRSWMKPVYDLLGVNTAYITENTPREERKALYNADVVYSTAKECGFDYLKDFAVFDKKDAVSGKLDRVIVDEADSLLIDEARIPLVAAGSYAVKADAELPKIFEYVKTLTAEDYEVSPETDSAYLTPRGQKRTEEHYGLSNIYDEENNGLLAAIGDCLEALYVLKEDINYIIKDNQVRIIDRFTGRVSEERHFPSLTHAAVELKHGLKVTERGATIGNIAIQYFIRLFNRVSGMTGTAASAKAEFESLYGLVVKTVEPNTPSRREDLPMAVYFDRKSKFSAAADETAEAYKRGQPVLVGTENIDMSEEFSLLLDERNVPHTVLNAKNDEAEAEIVKNAGMPSAVTVSTTMTGRGVDIKLGGEDEKYHDEVAEKGGLYVICTFTAESARINNQLYGRSGRQGDPGQSRLFTSVDETVMDIFGLRKNVPARHYPEATEEELTDKVLCREVKRIQRIAQGKRLDERKRLMEFNMINEKHRQAVFEYRAKLLSGDSVCNIWEEAFPEEYNEAVRRFGEKETADFQLETALAVTNERWSEYLEYTASLREGIHLRAIGGKNPAEEYNIECENYYLAMNEEMTAAMGEILTEALENGIDKTILPKPARTWTYLLADIADELKRKSLAEILLGDPEDYTDEYSDEYDEVYGEDESGYEAEEEAPAEEPKKGFFARLFGKK